MPPTAPIRTLPHAVTVVVGVMAIAALGFLCVVGPTIALGTPLMDAPLFPLLRTSIEHMHWATIAGLGCVGLAAGLITRLPAGLIAIASVITLPGAMFVEIARDATSHNLFPFELAMYAAMSLPVLLAAMVGRWWRNRTTARTTAAD